MTSKHSQPAKVDSFMASLEHPKADVLQGLRAVILDASTDVGEEIKWNAPTFFFTGPLPCTDPKEYRRVLVVSNLYRKDKIRLVFWQGARVTAHGGLLTGDYADGRRLAEFASLEEVETKSVLLQSIVREQIEWARNSPADA